MTFIYLRYMRANLIELNLVFSRRYDLADVSRQGMQVAAIQFYNDMIMYYKKKQVNPVL